MQLMFRDNRGQLGWQRLRIFTISLLIALGYSTVAASASFDVNCGGIAVGTVVPTPLGNQMLADFASTVGSLAGSARLCGEDHFNWYQIVTATNVNARDRQGNPLTPPFVDPPLNGLDPAIDPTWADNLPWYWDEFSPPEGTANFEPASLLSKHNFADILQFEDIPHGPPGDMYSFRTWLVSLNADSSFQSFHGSFSWDWSSVAGVSNVNVVLDVPTDAQYKEIIPGFAASVPEPFTFGFTALALALLGAGQLRRRSSHQARRSRMLS